MRGGLSSVGGSVCGRSGGVGGLGGAKGGSGWMLVAFVRWNFAMILKLGRYGMAARIWIGDVLILGSWPPPFLLLFCI